LTAAGLEAKSGVTNFLKFFSKEIGGGRERKLKEEQNRDKK
jgi:hypothetical protein